MEEDSIECVTTSSPERLYEAEVNYPSNHQNQSSKSRRKVSSPLISSANSVVELLECPVCANSMYPPIHQVIFGLQLSGLAIDEDDYVI